MTKTKRYSGASCWLQGRAVPLPPSMGRALHSYAKGPNYATGRNAALSAPQET